MAALIPAGYEFEEFEQHSSVTDWGVPPLAARRMRRSQRPTGRPIKRSRRRRRLFGRYSGLTSNSPYATPWSGGDILASLQPFSAGVGTVETMNTDHCHHKMCGGGRFR